MAMQVSYVDTTANGHEGPFLFYFQLDYDMLQEGPVALVLSLYDKDQHSFTEVDLFTLSDQQSTIITVLQGGMYTISIQPIASSENKFGKLGFKTTNNNFGSGCFKARYTYTLDSLNGNDAE